MKDVNILTGHVCQQWISWIVVTYLMLQNNSLPLSAVLFPLFQHIKVRERSHLFAVEKGGAAAWRRMFTAWLKAGSIPVGLEHQELIICRAQAHSDSIKVTSRQRFCLLQKSLKDM